MHILLAALVELTQKTRLEPNRRNFTFSKKITIFALSWIVTFSVFAQAQTLSELKGTIEISSDGKSWAPAFEGDTLAENAALRTLDESSVIIELNDKKFIKVAEHSEIVRKIVGYELTVGHLYIDAVNLQIFHAIPNLRIDGLVRVDVTDEYRRVAVFSGKALASVKANSNNRLISEGMQLLCKQNCEQNGDFVESFEGEILPYAEVDPWYIQQITVSGEGAKINDFLGQAEISTPEDATWQSANVNDVFDLGMQARTGADSWLELIFANDSILRLQANTEITFLKYNDFEDGSRQTVIDLAQGILWNVVEGEKQRFEVQTLGMVAGVRGTKFRIDAASSQNEPQIKVFEGEVLGVVDEVAVPVVQDQQFLAAEGVQVLVPDAIDEFNQTRDELIQNAERPVIQLMPNIRTIVLVDTDSITLQGQVKQTDNLFINDEPVKIADDNSFSSTINDLPKGENIIVIRAENIAYDEELTVTIFRQSSQ